MWAGTLLSEQQVAENLVPGEGESLVGVSLTPAMMPSEPLYAGDTVRIVSTPGDQGEVTRDAGHDRGHRGRRQPGGGDRGDRRQRRRPDEKAPDLASRAATGRVALVLDSRER